MVVGDVNVAILERPVQKMNILEYLEKTEKIYPHKVAVDDGNQCLTYTELVNLSKRIGTVLTRLIQPQKPVAVLMEKNAFTLAAMFGTIYAGCFYVIIDPGQPSYRLHKILDVLKTELVITNSQQEHLLVEAGYTGTTQLLEHMDRKKMNGTRLKQIRENSKGTDILYGMFTSGSSGVPKAVIVSHQSVINFIGHFTQIFDITQKDNIGNQAPFDFDVSVKDIYSAIMTGATLVLIPKQFFSMPPRLLDYLCDKRVTTLIWAVSALCLLSTLKGLAYRVPKDVTKVMFSGEVMPVKQLQIWQDALLNAKFVNLYGPTEVTCNCTYFVINRRFDLDEKIPIGKAFPGRDVFLLDEEGEKVATSGVTGEICVSGESLAHGYYNNREQIEQRFVSLKDKETGTKPCYMTGDLGCYGAGGQLYFCGRKDFQIKHMGHRIELEEIEKMIEQVKGISRGCCLFDSEADRLVAFYTGEVETKTIRKELKEKVPGYMVPNKIIKLDHMPLNKNGKIDRGHIREEMGV